MKDESSVLLMNQFQKHSRASVPSVVDQCDNTLLGSSGSDDVPATVMSRLLTHCYVAGVYASAEIERKLQKSLSLQAVPDAKAIQRFRRHNRAALQRALEASLQLLQHSAGSDKSPTVIRWQASEKLEIAAMYDLSLEE